MSHSSISLSYFLVFGLLYIHVTQHSERYYIYTQSDMSHSSISFSYFLVFGLLYIHVTQHSERYIYTG